MSADGELYVGETCRDYFADKIDKVFGKNKWKFDVSKFYDAWDMNIFPLKVGIDVMDIEGDYFIGKAVVDSIAIVVEDYERYIELMPKRIKITKFKKPIKND